MYVYEKFLKSDAVNALRAWRESLNPDEISEVSEIYCWKVLKYDAVSALRERYQNFVKHHQTMFLSDFERVIKCEVVFTTIFIVLYEKCFPSLSLNLYRESLAKTNNVSFSVSDSWRLAYDFAA